MSDSDDYTPCTCGHRGFDHSDIDLDALGECYVCDICYVFDPDPHAIIEDEWDLA